MEPVISLCDWNALASRGPHIHKYFGKNLRDKFSVFWKSLMLSVIKTKYSIWLALIIAKIWIKWVLAKKNNPKTNKTKKNTKGWFASLPFHFISNYYNLVQSDIAIDYTENK